MVEVHRFFRSPLYGRGSPLFSFLTYGRGLPLFKQ